MAAMSAIGPAVRSSDKAELLDCRKAIEFARDAGFLELVIEGDNVNAITAIITNVANQSMLGNVVEDIHQLLHWLNWVKISCTKRSRNQVAHTLAHYA